MNGTVKQRKPTPYRVPIRQQAQNLAKSKRTLQKMRTQPQNQLKPLLGRKRQREQSEQRSSQEEEEGEFEQESLEEESEEQQSELKTITEESAEEKKITKQISEKLNKREQKAKNKKGVPDGSDPNNPVRVYADGVFDMYHIGHAKVLEQAKKLFKHTHLIVGVSGDKETIEKKGKIVMSETERVEILKHCKWVDEVICPCPWVINVDFLKKNNIHYVAHDDAPYGSAGQDDIYAEIKKLGMFKATQRTDGISTSDIILRIIKDYDMYMLRSLQRGYSSKDLGVSGFKVQRIKLADNVKKLVHRFESEHIGKTFDEGYDKLRKRIGNVLKNWTGNSESFTSGFLNEYGEKHSLIGKILGIKKRSSHEEEEEEEQLSDFDF